MKIFAALAALPFAALPMQCQPAESKPAPPPAHQDSYGVSLDAQAACAVFNVRMWNSNDTARTGRIKVDGWDHSVLYVAPDASGSDTIYFPNDSGDHTVSVFWAGGTTSYRVPTDCAP